MSSEIKTTYYDNGQKESEGNYINGKKEGKWTEWHLNGNKKYEMDLVDGKVEGKWSWWDEEGNVTETD